MLKRLASSGAVNLLGTFAQLGAIVWLGRLLSAAEYGRVHVVLAAIPILAAVASANRVTASSSSVGSTTAGSPSLSLSMDSSEG